MDVVHFSQMLAHLATEQCKSPKQNHNMMVMKISTGNALIKNWMQWLLNRFI
jgi:hypothetical protein